MTGNAEFAAIRIAKVGAIEIGVVLRPQSGPALGGAAMGQRHLIGLPNASPIDCKESHHLAIAWSSRLSVMRRADQKQRPRPACRLPAGPRPAAITEPRLDP